MKTSEQIQSIESEKSGQTVARQRFGKSDARYWHDVIFKPAYRRGEQTYRPEEWAARMQWRGRRELFNVRTPNKAAAAAKAREIYAMLVGSGWEATLAKFKPEMECKSVSTVGDFLTELRARGRASRKRSRTTAGVSGRSLRRFWDRGRTEKSITSTVDASLGCESTASNSQTTPDEVNKWRIAFVKRPVSIR
jgi:hypothetical protein